ncbi:MAG TPA: hypothetical protein VF477_07485, partial [Mycobacterium sp.]
MRYERGVSQLHHDPLMFFAAATIDCIGGLISVPDRLAGGLAELAPPTPVGVEARGPLSARKLVRRR